MDTISFKRHRFPPEIIRRAVWLYARFALSYRDVAQLLAERREEAYRAGDLERAAELSREPNVHLGPARHRGEGGAALQEKLQKAARVERMNVANAAGAGRRPPGGGAGGAGDRRDRGAAEGDL